MDQSENNARKLTNELRALRQRSRPDNTIVPSERQATRSPEIIELVPADTPRPRRTAELIVFGLLLAVLAWALVSPPIFTAPPHAVEQVVNPPKAQIASPDIPLPLVQASAVSEPILPPVVSAPAPAPAPEEPPVVTLHKSVPVRAAQGKVMEDDGSDSFRVVDPPGPATAP